MSKITLSKSYWVWFDLACEDFMALEKRYMTQALFDELTREGIEVLQAKAETPKQAISQVFPERASGRIGVHFVAGLRPGDTASKHSVH